MAPIAKGGIVAVTGAAGFIGGRVVRQLLDKGYRVRACVRNEADQYKVGFLKAMPGYGSGRLTLHSADLNEDGCFNAMGDAIMCCPADNVGPIQSAHQGDGGPWQLLMKKMLEGDCDPSMHGYWPWHTVDVRDTAACHIGILESVHVRNGERYLAWAAERADIEDACQRIDQLLPELGFATPDTSEDLDDKGLERREGRRKVY